MTEKELPYIRRNGLMVINSGDKGILLEFRPPKTGCVPVYEEVLSAILRIPVSGDLLPSWEEIKANRKVV